MKNRILKKRFLTLGAVFLAFFVSASSFAFASDIDIQSDESAESGVEEASDVEAPDIEIGLDEVSGEETEIIADTDADTAEEIVPSGDAEESADEADAAMTKEEYGGRHHRDPGGPNFGDRNEGDDSGDGSDVDEDKDDEDVDDDEDDEDEDDEDVDDDEDDEDVDDDEDDEDVDDDEDDEDVDDEDDKDVDDKDGDEEENQEEAGTLDENTDGAVNDDREDEKEEEEEEEEIPQLDEAVCVKLDVKTGEITPGLMLTAPLRPHDDRFGDNDSLILPGFEDVWYTILDEESFEEKNESVPDRLTEAANIIADNVQARLDELEYDYELVQFGRIDSQAWKDEYINRDGQTSLLIAPQINGELEASGVDHDEFIWLAIGDRNGNLLCVYVMDREAAGIENIFDNE